MNDGNKHEGHRKRLNNKVKRIGLEALEEHEALESILFAVIPRGNTNEIAHDLLDEFGSIRNVLLADTDRLTEVKNVGTRTAGFLKSLMPLLGIVERCAVSNNGKIVLDTNEKIGNYAKSLFYDKLVENLYMISLDSSMRVICFDKIAEGTAGSAAVSVHKIAKAAISNEAYYVILAHNHPGGRCEPSIADMNMTRSVQYALDTLDITLKAHVVVACGEYKMIFE